MSFISGNSSEFFQRDWYQSGPSAYTLALNILKKEHTYILVLGSKTHKEIKQLLKSQDKYIKLLYEGPGAVNYWHDNTYDAKIPRQWVVIFEPLMDIVEGYNLVETTL